MKVPFSMPEFSSRNFITYRYHIDNAEGDAGVCYDMIIGRGIMVQIGPKTYFLHKVLKWDETLVHMKEPVILLGKPNSTQCEMR